MEKFLVCPLCGEKTKNVLAHYKIHDFHINTREKFLELYPEWGKNKLQISDFKKSEYKCSECGKTYKKANGLAIHVKFSHPDIWKEKRDEQTKKNKLVCPICKKHTNDMKQHSRLSHNYKNWEDFCKDTNWDRTVVKNISDEYRKHLSENKKKFYRNTKRGKELLREQALKISGDKNPSKNAKVREKMMLTRALNSFNKVYSPPGKFSCVQCRWKGNRFRSFEELLFSVSLYLNNLDFVYEPREYVVQYYNDDKGFLTTYNPDFYIPSMNKLLELKTGDIEKIKTESKFVKVSEIYKKINVSYEVIQKDEWLKRNNIEFDIDKVVSFIIEEFDKGEIEFICRPNSRFVKKIVGSEDLHNVKGVKIV